MNYLLNNDIWFVVNQYAYVVPCLEEVYLLEKRGYRLSELFGGDNRGQASLLCEAIIKNQTKISSMLCTNYLRHIYGNDLFDIPELQTLYPHLIYLIFRDNDIEAARPLDKFEKLIRRTYNYYVHVVNGLLFRNKKNSTSALSLIQWYCENFSHTIDDKFKSAMLSCAFFSNDMSLLVWLNLGYDLGRINSPIVLDLFKIPKHLIEYYYDHNEDIRTSNIYMNIDRYVKNNDISTTKHLLQKFPDHISLNKKAIRFALVKGYYEMLEILLHGVDCDISRYGFHKLNKILGHRESSRADLEIFIEFQEKLDKDETMISCLNTNCEYGGRKMADFLRQEILIPEILENSILTLVTRGCFDLLLRLKKIFYKRRGTVDCFDDYLWSNPLHVFKYYGTVRKPIQFLAISPTIL